MKRPLTAAIFGVLVALVSPLDTAHSDDNWRVHHNGRYDFSISYPSSLFAIEKTSEAGDGHVFYAAEVDARLLVGALINQEAYTPASYLDYIANRSYPNYTISYRRLGETWFALSGQDGERIFYEKVQFSCSGRLISSFAMIYPTSSRTVIDPVIERMEDSFRSARDCSSNVTHALPLQAPSRANVPMRKTAPSSRTTQSGNRSRHQRAKTINPRRATIAGRLEKQRYKQRRVIVVLRRTTPPYDLRFVRGVATTRSY